jgi:hypothetical protein
MESPGWSGSPVGLAWYSMLGSYRLLRQIAHVSVQIFWGWGSRGSGGNENSENGGAEEGRGSTRVQQVPKTAPVSVASGLPLMKLHTS